jgi:hypothetical protein
MAFIPKSKGYYGYGPLASDNETFAVARMDRGSDYRLCECVQEFVAQEIAEMYAAKYKTQARAVKEFK